MPTMLQVATRLGLPGSSILEHRFLSVDIASTLLYWDNMAAQDAARSAGESALVPQSTGPQVKTEAVEGGPEAASDDKALGAGAGAAPLPAAGADVDQPGRCKRWWQGWRWQWR